MGPPALTALADPAFPPLRQAAAELGLRAWAVGGYVRDLLLGRTQPDLDIVVEDGRALDLAVRFAQLTGARSPVLFPRFGTAQVTWRDRLIEFASARAESYAADSRKPEVRPVSIEQDLRRRDFTVNAMLLDFDGRLLDPLGGRVDLERRLLRTPAEPERAFSDDPLRMLRAARLAAQLGFDLDPALLPAMRRLRERARPPVLSVERIHEELVKLLLSERPRRGLEILDEGGLLELLLPELAACHGVEQGNWHTHDVFGHTLLAVDKAAPDLTVRLAALLHDIGKPPTATPDGAFHGHDLVGAAMAEEVMTRLRFSRSETDNVSRLVRLHLRPVFYEPENWGAAAVRRLARDAGELLQPLLQLARADIAASAYPDAWKLDDLERRLQAVLQNEAKVLRPPVEGGDIMRIRGIGPGPEVGRLKAALTELVLEGELPPEREAISAYLAAHPEL
ncbi:MAG: HD domain-containing protein [Candidatus Dormibacteraeota bacterium]|uniref:HD domain-containing protein n=1 Tax=Candidatus Dormiibacter inghamiae TaxID=3127013 RepID=A0A934KBW0_9BACT|nr:HD domain-containing protein [Candidatus Dormibacteraeota bacterium]MBJ7607354.1 HD domain-containing protein [Candidatus Dormibacteraeota bacterium]